MIYVQKTNLQSKSCIKEPFPHLVIDNFFKEEHLDKILNEINLLKDEDAMSYNNPDSPFEYNKLAFQVNYGEYLEKVFIELNSPEFIKHIESITGIKDLITNEINLEGAGIHRIKKNGFLEFHTDFNYYNWSGGLLDRRVNLLIYMNPDWKPEYKGDLLLADIKTQECFKRISPILNRAVIFNTTNKSIHGHPERLQKDNRQSIAMYYYTRNKNYPLDFEGDEAHMTLWHTDINIDNKSPNKSKN